MQTGLKTAWNAVRNGLREKQTVRRKMMKEILFRGKREDNGEWIYGYYAVIGRKTVIIKAEHEIFYSVEEEMKKRHGNEIAEVLQDTVCQYTGLTDKNGRKIFEGDIVETAYDGKVNPKYVVVWDADELDFKATNGKEHYKTDYEYLGCCEEIIVIGNIFDDTELAVVAYGGKEE